MCRDVESKAAQVQVKENTAKLLVKTVSWMNVRVGIASIQIQGYSGNRMPDVNPVS
jgi:hypothetical protein